MHVCTQLKVMSGLRGWVMVTLKTSADKQVHYTFPSQMKTLHRVMLLILNKWWNNLLSLFVFDANKMEDHKKSNKKNNDSGKQKWDKFSPESKLGAPRKQSSPWSHLGRRIWSRQSVQKQRGGRVMQWQICAQDRGFLQAAIFTGQSILQVKRWVVGSGLADKDHGHY